MTKCNPTNTLSNYGSELIAPDEIWKAIENYGGLYEVSSVGRVRSHRHAPPLMLSPSRYRDGYFRIGLWNGEHQQKFALHRLVATAFHGGKQNALHNEVAHLDGNPANCRADNLKWVGKVENHSHKRRHGTHQSGERHPRAKLLDAQVLTIFESADPHKDLAMRYAVSRYTISEIKSGKRWASVTRTFDHG